MSDAGSTSQILNEESEVKEKGAEPVESNTQLDETQDDEEMTEVAPDAEQGQDSNAKQSDEQAREDSNTAEGQDETVDDEENAKETKAATEHADPIAEEVKPPSEEAKPATEQTETATEQAELAEEQDKPEEANGVTQPTEVTQSIPDDVDTSIKEGESQENDVKENETNDAEKPVENLVDNNEQSQEPTTGETDGKQMETDAPTADVAKESGAADDDIRGDNTESKKQEEIGESEENSNIIEGDTADPTGDKIAEQNEETGIIPEERDAQGEAQLNEKVQEVMEETADKPEQEPTSGEAPEGQKAEDNEAVAVENPQVEESEKQVEEIPANTETKTEEKVKDIELAGEVSKEKTKDTETTGAALKSSTPQAELVPETSGPKVTKTPKDGQEDERQEAVAPDVSAVTSEKRPGSRGSRTSRRSNRSKGSQGKQSAVDQTPVIPEPPPIPDPITSPEEPEPPSTMALSMAWSFGMSRQIPVINLTTKSRCTVLYACAHTAVMYNFASNRQTLLHGHSHAITCTCVSADKRWLVTADQGADHMIIVWETDTGIPVRTIFSPYADRGVCAVAMTPDAKYLASISAAGPHQTLSVWDWTVEADVPICSVDLSTNYGLQSYVLFNPEDSTQIVTNSDHQVVFYKWGAGCVELMAPPLTDEDFNKPVGRYSQTIYQSSSTRALTATSIGNLVVWENNYSTNKEVESVVDKRALKLVRLQERGLSVITTTDQFIVIGDVAGHIKFFDQSLKLINWYQDFNLGPVNAISFGYWPDFDAVAGANSKYPPDATIAARPFVLRDFVVGTTTAVYGSVTTDGTDVKVIHRDHDAPVHALCCHPTKPHTIVGSYSGLLKVWDYESRRTIVSRSFDKGLLIQCCNIDPKGVYIALGLTNGSVRVLDALSLDDVTSFRYARGPITHIAFSHDSSFFATADADCTVTLYRARYGEGVIPWVYVGRHRSHYKRIAELMFDVQLDTEKPRLMSLGEDRYLVEYDLEGSSKDDLRIDSSDRIEQSATPMFMAAHPPVTKESFIVTANDQFKYKLYNSTTKMCRQTSLGPCFGDPIKKLLILPSSDPLVDKQYMAFITTDKIGLQILPLDGNPHNAMALTAHPQQVVNLACSYDGKYLFTAGGSDACVHMWKVNLEALEASAKLGGEDLIPFYGLLDGGREGELFRELEDYFYYAQIRSQGVNTMEQREVSTHIPLAEIPFVMRALGFYPSQQEIEDMLNEVKFSNYVNTGVYKTDINLGEFIRLYINHRPAFGLQPEKLSWAFEVLGICDGSRVGAGSKPAIDRGELLDLLQNHGEHMSEYELAEYLTTLLGFNPEGGSCEQQEFDPTDAGSLIEENLAQNIDVDTFANDLLNFGMHADVLQVEGGEAGAGGHGMHGSQLGDATPTDFGLDSRMNTTVM